MYLCQTLKVLYFFHVADCGDYGEERLGPFYVKHLLKIPNLSPDIEAQVKAKHAEFRYVSIFGHLR